METESATGDRRRIFISAIPLAITIAAYGIIFGAGAREPLGVGGTLLASAVIFSGSVQFALVGLLLAGTSWAAILITAAFLNARHVVLGAALRPRIRTSVTSRFGLAWWMVDEAAALALLDPISPRSTLLVTGILFYVSWLIGTTVGLLIGSAGDVATVAVQITPVLFIGLTVLLATSKKTIVRCIVGATLTLGVSLIWPSARAGAALVIACLVAIPGGEE